MKPKTSYLAATFPDTFRLSLQHSQILIHIQSFLFSQEQCVC